jgi:hypothetical protein
MNPAGCKVIGFKQPTPEDLEHDFLWRIHPYVPNKRSIGSVALRHPPKEPPEPGLTVAARHRPVTALNESRRVP